MKDIEFAKYGFDFRNMLKQVRRYRSEEFFPHGVSFVESPDLDYKQEIQNPYPWTRHRYHIQAIELLEKIHKRVDLESYNGNKRICYLIVSHEFFVDNTAKALER